MYIGSSINKSPTFSAVAGAEIINGAGKAVKFDGSGNIILCSSAGEAAIGILIMQTAEKVASGESVTVQISDRGQAVAGDTITAGDLLAVNSSGALVKAAETNYVVGQALTAGTNNGFVEVILCRGGQLNAGA